MQPTKYSPISVEMTDSMGTDLSVVNAARVSFAKESEYEHWTEQTSPNVFMTHQALSDRDQKLIRYLAEHNHWSPFAHSFLQFRIKAPIFVARQMVKHQIGLAWNEVSRRYVDDAPEFYLPDSWRLRADNIKQGSSNKTFTPKGQKGRCLYCGQSFTSNGNSQRFCEPNCQAKHYRKTPEGWEKSKLARLKSSAKRRGILFDLKTVPMPKTCKYLGIELNYGAEVIQDDSPSVDRIDNSKGYVEGNIQVISNKANKIKGNCTFEEMQTFSKAYLMEQGGYVMPQADSYDSFLSEMSQFYKHLIEQGMAPEQARMFLPQCQMTEWIWSGSLFAFARICNLRLDPHAQKESRDLALGIHRAAKDAFPHSWAALVPEFRDVN